MKILNRWTDAILWEGEAGTVGEAVIAALKTGADLRGADLRGADMTGADLTDKKVSKLLARVTRTDGYEFLLWLFQDGSHVIRAGCQTRTIADYRQHVAEDYPTRQNAAEVTRETLAMLDYLERRLTDEATSAVGDQTQRARA